MTDHETLEVTLKKPGEQGPPNQVAHSALPERIGRYRIERVLGKGGFGLVYLAHDEQLSRRVAVKVPHAHLISGPEDAELYLAEARTVANLDHPTIVPVHDVGGTPEFPCYVVSKYIEGSNLATRLKQSQLGHTQTAELIATIAEALHYAHKQGLVHRDVKPGNILIGADGRPFLADFGLALREQDLGHGPRFVGTPAYMSPEQARGEGHRVDGRSDIFSLGVVFYELLVSRRPFTAPSQSELLDQITSLDVRPPRQIDDTVPKELERICLKALSKRAADRYTTAKDLADDLRHFLSAAPRLDSTIPVAAPAAGVPSSTAGETHVPSDMPPATPDSDKRPVRIVPKGLRSFDRHDADFFLELLPGPRDRDGLPDSIRFWKTRIEETDPDQTFSVGLIYGPSGCGKSSLVKAGLLPRLSGDVLAVYIEATAEETETRLLNGLRKACPALADNLDLSATLAALRCGRGMSDTSPTRQRGRKVLIVLDQFEQWLHAPPHPALSPGGRGLGEGENTELVQALRQCDGGRLQCIVMVRDDFWLAVSRFMLHLEVDLVSGKNVSLTDLFDLDHAGKVLAAFGRAFGKLPEHLRVGNALRGVPEFRDDIAPPERHGGRSLQEQREFLDQAIAGLAQGGKVVCVRLALFAEMMKGKPWTPAMLKEVGGARGVGVTFLEETFSSQTANPKHRLHQKAARHVLKALLPESGGDIKGHMRSFQELLAASGYANRPTDFDDLVRILDGELRLITPTDPEGVAERQGDWETGRQGDREHQQSRNEPNDKTPSDSVSPCLPVSVTGYYQLTHDYLVPSLRDWLTRKQRETRRGRAELRLAERSATWNAKPERRYLPSLWEYLSIVGLTPRKNWTGPQAKMMAKSGRVHAIRGGLAAMAAALVIAVGFFIKGQIEDRQNARIAQARVEYLVAANTADIEGLVIELDRYRAWATPLLQRVALSGESRPKEKLHASLALVKDDSAQVDYLFDRLLTANSDDVPVIVKFLSPHKGALSERLWRIAKSGSRAQQMRAAAALASYEPGDPRWQQAAPDVATAMVSAPLAEAKQWIKLLGPAGAQLAEPLAARYRDRGPERDAQRPLAAAALADYWQNEPQKLTELVLLADNDREFRPLLEALRPHRPPVSTELKGLIALSPPDVQGDDAAQIAARDALWSRQATAAVCLLELGEQADVWPLLKSSPDPSLRSFLIERLARLGATFDTLAGRLEDGQEPDASIRQALVLALGEFDLGQRSVEERQRIVNRLAAVYREDPDSGIHSAAAWTLRHWHEEGVVARADEQFEGAPKTGSAKRENWFTNSQGQTFVVVRGPVEFVTGEKRTATDALAVTKLSHSFAVAACEVTVQQFRQFRKDYQYTQRYAPDAACPAIDVSWFDAAAYCNWLSEQEGLPRDQWCYEPNSKGDYAEGMTIAADFLKRPGYRLPTEAEWECVCRAGTASDYSFGEPAELLARYGWYSQNSGGKTWPVARLRPNALGAFDVHGNAWEWCQDLYEKRATEGAETVNGKDPRVLRGGSFNLLAPLARSSYRGIYLPANRSPYYGFRVARTYP